MAQTGSKTYSNTLSQITAFEMEASIETGLTHF